MVVISDELWEKLMPGKGSEDEGCRWISNYAWQMVVDEARRSDDPVSAWLIMAVRKSIGRRAYECGYPYDSEAG